MKKPVLQTAVATIGTIERLYRLWEDAAMTALENSRRANGTAQQKNTTNEGGVKQQARELQRKDPTKLKEADLVKLLEYSKNKLLADGSYIPVRINTPQILIAFAKEQGYTLDNHPIAMRVYKARQAMANVAEWDGNFKDTPHNLTPKEIVEIIRAMDNPTYLVFQSRNERFSEIVKFNKGKEKAYAIIDFFDVNKNAEIMNGYKGGKYNILVTVYPADDADNLKAYLKNKENKVITSEEIKKKGLSQRGLGSYVPAHLNDSPFFNDSIPQTDENFKDNVKKSDRDSLGNNLTAAQQEYFADSKVRDDNGNLLRLYHGTKNGGFTKFNPKYSDDGITLFLTPSRELANTYTTSNENVKLPEGKKGLARLFETGTKKGNGQAGIYEVYANVKNPYIMDCDGANWNKLPFHEKIKDATTLDTENRFDYKNNILYTKATIDGEVYEKTFDFNHLVEPTNAALEETAKRINIDKKVQFKHFFTEQAETELREYYSTFANEKIVEQLWKNAEVAMELHDGITRTYRGVINNKTGNVEAMNTRFISKWAKENGYDGVWFKNIRDTGGASEFQGADAVVDVIVAYDGSQIKSVDNLNPTKNKDIRYADREYSYNELVNKPNLKGIIINKTEQVKLSIDGSIDEKFIVDEVQKRCQKIRTQSTTPTYYVNAQDIGRNVEITGKGIVHGFFDSAKKNTKPSQRDLINARVSLAIPEIIANSIEVNRSSRGGNIDNPYSHIMMGTVGLEDANGKIEYYAVRSVIQERANQNPILVEAKILGKLYAVNAKKIGSPNLKVTKNSVARRYDETYEYSVANLLNDVKNIFDNTFSLDVYQHFEMHRKNDKFSKNLLYSDRDNVSVYDKIGEVDKLIKENEMLHEDVEMLKKRLQLEGKVTHGEYFNQNQLNAVAGHIRSLANSSFDKKTLASLIDGIYKYISHSEDLNWQDMFAQCYDVARMVLDEAKPVKTKNDYNEYVLKQISGATLYANEAQMSRECSGPCVFEDQRS